MLIILPNYSRPKLNDYAENVMPEPDMYPTDTNNGMLMITIKRKLVAKLNLVNRI